MFALPEMITILYIGLGVSLGIVVGAIPGLTASMLIALSLPLTFSMDAINSISLLVAMYVGGVSGSLITAILMRMPGTPASVITTLDGYPMTKRGEADKALSLSIWASFFGGIISWLFLILLAKPLSILAVHFSEFDFFAMVVMALLLIVLLSKGNMIKGLIAGCLGILVAVPGADPIDGNFRFTLGTEILQNGLPLLPVLIGLFAGNQILNEVIKSVRGSTIVSEKTKALSFRPSQMKKHTVNIIRSSFIGTWIGILPGVGANIGSAFSYSIARTFSKEPKKFGDGSEEGIVASETANNATVGGALVPLISLGIPGSVVDAILLGGLVIHGLQPGPFLFKNEPEFVYAIFTAVLIANLMMLVMMFSTTRWIARIARVPKHILLPPLAIMCVVGTFSYANSWDTVIVMFIFSAVGFVLERHKYPLAPFVIGFILAPIAESSFRAATMYTNGEVLPLLYAPVPIIVFITTVVMAVLNRRM